MTINTYWLKFPRNFDNEYCVGVATSKADGDQYQAEEYKRIDRDYALRLMSRVSSNAEQLYATVTIDGVQAYNRFEVARAIRKGQEIDSLVGV